MINLYPRVRCRNAEVIPLPTMGRPDPFKELTGQSGNRSVPGRDAA